MRSPALHSCILLILRHAAHKKTRLGRTDGSVSTICSLLLWSRGEARRLFHESGECILPMGKEVSYRTQPPLGKYRVGRTPRKTSHLFGCDRPNRDREAHKTDNRLSKLMPGTIATVRHVTNSPQVTRGEIFQCLSQIVRI